MRLAGAQTVPLLARQAIVDERLRTVGFELLYRGPRGRDGRPLDEDGATADVVWNAWMEIGRTALAGDLPLWVNVGAGLLLDPAWPAARPGDVVLEVLEGTPVDDALVAALRRLRRAGHRIALDDFVPGSAAEALVEVAHVVKLDVLARGVDGVLRDARALRGRGVAVVAEKVETREAATALVDGGIRLLQGWFYEQPVVLTGTPVPSRAVAAVQACAGLLDAGDDLEAIEAIVGDDPVLAFRLTRLASSSFYGARRPIETVRDALVRVGVREARRWLLMLSVRGLADPRHPALIAGVQRAHLCAALAAGSADEIRDRAFLCGLLSVLDRLVAPLPDLLEQVDLAPAVADALLRHVGPEGELLAAATALQRGSVPAAVRPDRAGSIALEAFGAAGGDAARLAAA